MNAASLSPAPSLSHEISPERAPEPAGAPVPESRPYRRCRCGTDRTNRAASPEREYSLAGACYLLWGGTSVPTRVRFRCIFCGNVFDECTDRATLRRYIT
jgi:hypothetical protein